MFQKKFIIFFLNASICIRRRQNACRMNCANVLCTKLSKKEAVLFNGLKSTNYLCHFVMKDPVYYISECIRVTIQPIFFLPSVIQGDPMSFVFPIKSHSYQTIHRQRTPWRRSHNLSLNLMKSIFQLLWTRDASNPKTRNSMWPSEFNLNLTLQYFSSPALRAVHW